MKMNHTPGPWRTVAASAHKSNPQTTRRDIIGKCEFGDVYVAGDISKEDARLIASAPELLSALVALLEQADLGEVDEETGPIVEAARAAIAKATGEK